MRSLRRLYTSLSIRKYSCSAPAVALTELTLSFPNILRMRRHCLLRASMERRSGVFLSSAWPPYEQKAVGIYSTSSLIKAYEVGSHAVYPLASKVARSPPLGKLEASGSPWMSSLPENSMIALPPPAGVMKLSCFSAVMPVMGWNQWVKCVAPFSTAQFFIASATMAALSLLRRLPSFIAWSTLSKTSSGRRSFITDSLNTIVPKRSAAQFISVSSGVC